MEPKSGSQVEPKSRSQVEPKSGSPVEPKSRSQMEPKSRSVPSGNSACKLVQFCCLVKCAGPPHCRPFVAHD